MHARIHAYLTLILSFTFALILFLFIIILREGKYEKPVLAI
jgi:hypothetical protein